MTYEPIHERFEIVGPDGKRLEIVFVRSGFLTQGDRPELFFFRVNGEETVVGISSDLETGMAPRATSSSIPRVTFTV